MTGKTFFEGCGIGIALTLNYTWGHLSPRHIDDLYLRMLPVNTVIGGATVDLLAVSAAGILLIAALDRFDAERKTPAWAVVAAAVFAILVRTIFVLAETSNHGLTSLLLFSIAIVPGLTLWLMRGRGYRIWIAGFRWGLLGLGFCILWMAPRLIYLYAEREPRDVAAFHRTLPAGTAQPQRRVIWILLDELSYDQTFDHRQADLSLPHFDALRTASTSFADVQPAGYYTDEIIPALLRGKAIVEERSGPDGTLSVRASHDAAWEKFDAQTTVFGDAQRSGWTTGIAGWYNPYCRILATVADNCAWFADSAIFHGHMNSGNTVLENAVAPLRPNAHTSLEGTAFSEHRVTYSALMASSLALVRDPGIGFVFVHLPVPHPPGIYDRASRTLRNGGSYLDNLVLADDALGTLRAAIDATPDAGTTTLVVSGDHSMRVPKWRGGNYWTSEDEQVFHDRFDTRPVLMVHFAGETAGRDVSGAFDELRTHDLVEALLQGKVTDEAELEQWVGL